MSKHQIKINSKGQFEQYTNNYNPKLHFKINELKTRHSGRIYTKKNFKNKIIYEERK